MPTRREVKEVGKQSGGWEETKRRHIRGVVARGVNWNSSTAARRVFSLCHQPLSEAAGPTSRTVTGNVEWKCRQVQECQGPSAVFYNWGIYSTVHGGSLADVQGVGCGFHGWREQWAEHLLPAVILANHQVGMLPVK